MERVVRLTESDLVKLVKRVVREQSEQEMMNATPVNFASLGMDAREAIGKLVEQGYMWKTDAKTKPTPPYEAGLYFFTDNQGSTDQKAIKLANNVLAQIRKAGGQLGVNNGYIIDAITGLKSGSYSMFKKG
jgi:hypothetical protein